ncbi:MAG: hypothetical protein J1E02_07240 [Coprobacter sp.]|nr:hypothetical protein [Coprobacter sp.]
MKYFPLLLLLALPCTGQTVVSDTDTEPATETASGLYGPVSAVRTTFRFAPRKQSTSGSESYITVVRYNPEGQRTEQKMYSEDSTLIGSVTFQFTPEHRLGETDYLDMYGNLVSRVVYVYDKAGRKTSATVYRGAFYPTEQISYGYNTQGQVCDIVKNNALNFPTEKELLYYNCRGQDSVKLFYDGHHHLKSAVRFQYYPDGRLLGYEQTGPSGEIAKRYHIAYRPDGNTLSSELQEYYPGYTVTTRTEYDAWENPVKETRMTPGNETETTVMQYRYDKHNNWIFKRISTDNRPTTSALREISYY